MTTARAIQQAHLMSDEDLAKQIHVVAFRARQQARDHDGRSVRLGVLDLLTVLVDELYGRALAPPLFPESLYERATELAEAEMYRQDRLA